MLTQQQFEVITKVIVDCPWTYIGCMCMLGVTAFQIGFLFGLLITR
jgi:hypothetical protein